MEDRITKILEGWYLMEPPLFQVLCCHEMAVNRDMPCPVRCGRKRVEYNPDILDYMSDTFLEESLKTEAIRLLMKHPYERRPDGCCQQAIAMGSNVVVGDNYKFREFPIEIPLDFQLKKGMPYEWYSRQIQQQLPPSGTEPGDEQDEPDEQVLKYQALAELWDEDELCAIMINGIIENTKDWGSLSGAFAEKLKASTKAKIDFRKLLGGFRSSIISSKRRLTRMRPDRRYGFDQMGQKREYDTKLLVAVDVSGSVSSESLSYFYGVINSAFRYGFQAVDVIQFDCGIRVVQSLQKIIKDVTIIGRGGTSFQEPINYAHENGYDGLLILTDGYAPQPTIPDNMRCKILWACENEECYEVNHHWMETIGRVCTIELS